MSPASSSPGPGDERPSSADRGTELAEARTDLAVERSFLAFERTLMAWLRTSFSMISFGFTLVKFFQYLEEQRGGPLAGPFGRTWVSDSLGFALIAIGTGSLIVAVIQHKRCVDALRELGLPPQWNLTMLVGTLVALLGMLALVTLLLGI